MSDLCRQHQVSCLLIFASPFSVRTCFPLNNCSFRRFFDFLRSCFRIQLNSFAPCLAHFHCCSFLFCQHHKYFLCFRSCQTSRLHLCLQHNLLLLVRCSL